MGSVSLKRFVLGDLMEEDESSASTLSSSSDDEEEAYQEARYEAVKMASRELKKLTKYLSQMRGRGWESRANICKRVAVLLKGPLSGGIQELESVKHLLQLGKEREEELQAEIRQLKRRIEEGHKVDKVMGFGGRSHHHVHVKEEEVVAVAAPPVIQKSRRHRLVKRRGESGTVGIKIKTEDAAPMCQLVPILPPAPSTSRSRDRATQASSSSRGSWKRLRLPRHVPVITLEEDSSEFADNESEGEIICLKAEVDSSDDGDTMRSMGRGEVSLKADVDADDGVIVESSGRADAEDLAGGNEAAGQDGAVVARDVGDMDMDAVNREPDDVVRAGNDDGGASISPTPSLPEIKRRIQPRRSCKEVGKNDKRSASPGKGKRIETPTPTRSPRAAHGSNSDQRRFTCPVCNRGFARKDVLNKHAVVHSDQRPFSCPHPQCNMSFKLKGGLTTHGRVHTRERPFQCGACGKCFSRRSNMNRHVQNVHAGQG